MLCRAQSLSRVQLFVTPWTVVHQTLLSMEFSRQEYWSGLSFPTPGDLPNPGTEQGSPALQMDSYQLSYQESPYSNYIRLKIRLLTSHFIYDWRLAAITDNQNDTKFFKIGVHFALPNSLNIRSPSWSANCLRADTLALSILFPLTLGMALIDEKFINS